MNCSRTSGTFFSKYVIAVLLSLVTFSASAQEYEEEEKKGFRKENLFIGGNFGLVLGDYTLLNLSPQLGYRFNQYLAAGLGINALYVSDKQYDYWGNAWYKTSQGLLGLNIFGRVYPFQYMMIQAQPELNYLFGKQKYYNPPLTTELDAEIVPSLLMGGGVVLPSERSSFIISVMYDVLQNDNSPYGRKPFVNFGYTFNLR
ncbi:MAG TPA: hypothetical protein VFZ78_13310 [Flavisolibacter sp.]